VEAGLEPAPVGRCGTMSHMGQPDKQDKQTNRWDAFSDDELCGIQARLRDAEGPVCARLRSEVYAVRDRRRHRGPGIYLYEPSQRTFRVLGALASPNFVIYCDADGDLATFDRRFFEDILTGRDGAHYRRFRYVGPLSERADSGGEVGP
jgi:hypothetical protein